MKKANPMDAKGPLMLRYDERQRVWQVFYTNREGSKVLIDRDRNQAVLTKRHGL